jgi:DHA1 family multidrug/chloramphenicol efflux transport protein-like MFS transporter
MSTQRALLQFSIFFILYELTVYLSNDMIMPGMPLVVAQFNGASRHIALSLSLYILGGSLLQVFLGPLAERYGKRRILLCGNALFLVATALVPLAQTMPQFLTIRFFQGMGSCFIFLGYATIHELFDDVQAVKLTTLFSNTTVFAPLIGPVVGSAIIAVLPWQAVFVTAFALGLIAWIGLWRAMPGPSAAPPPTSVAAIAASYRRILGNRSFMFGIFIAGIAITPLTAWIGLSPAIVLEHMQQPYSVYIAYQCVIFTGFILSTVAIQRIGDTVSLTRLIRQGGALALIGMAGAGVTYAHPQLYIGCMFLFSAGFGLFNGALVRLSLTATGESMSLTSSAMSLLYCIYIALGLELYNLLCEHYHYALSAYALVNVPLGIVIFLCLLRFAAKHDQRQLALQGAV